MVKHHGIFERKKARLRFEWWDTSQAHTANAASQSPDAGADAEPQPEPPAASDASPHSMNRSGFRHGKPAGWNAARRRSSDQLEGVELAGQVLELAPQFLVLEDLVEGRRLELLDRLEGGGAVAHQVAQLEARLHRLEGVVGDAQVVRRARARLGDLLALLQQIAAVALGGLLGQLLAVAVGFERALLVGAVLGLQQLGGLGRAA